MSFIGIFKTYFEIFLNDFCGTEFLHHEFKSHLDYSAYDICCAFKCVELPLCACKHSCMYVCMDLSIFFKLIVEQYTTIK